MAYFLKNWAENTGRQVLMVTHQKAFMQTVDKAIEMDQIDGISIVGEQVRNDG